MSTPNQTKQIHHPFATEDDTKRGSRHIPRQATTHIMHKGKRRGIKEISRCLQITIPKTTALRVTNKIRRTMNAYLSVKVIERMDASVALA